MTPDKFLDGYSDISLPLYGVKLPKFQIPEKYYNELGISKESSNFDFMRALCLKSFKALKLEKDSDEYKRYAERTKHELGLIEELGFTDYILLVWDVINFCKENGIPTGRGRGSAAGSLVLDLIGITRVDPIKYGLYFERFISRTRAKKQIIDGITYLDGKLMMDVDLDIDYYRRGEVIQYLENKFSGRVSKILTINTLTGKLLIKECGKIVGAKSEQEMNTVSGHIPKHFGIVTDIEEAYNGKKKADGEYEIEPVKDFVDWCDENRETYDIALKLRGLIKNKGVHASGILVSCDPLEETCPQELTSDKQLVSSYTMDWASLLNIKLDLLGLRAVSVVEDVCKQLGISADDINVDNPEIYDYYKDLKTPHGLFQIEAETNLKVCQKVKPKNLEHLSGVLALARPGALQFIDNYADYVNTGNFNSIHPFFDDVLSKTGGICLYQEQAMKMANKIGFSLEDSESIRRCVGKKLVKEMKSWEEKIKDKIRENKLDPQIGEIFWKILDDSAKYQFNFSHSLSYASLSAITTYLKFKHPKEFFLSLLKMTRFEPDPISEISKIQKELSCFGIKLLPPHILKSSMDFKIEGDDIRFGLLSIKGISDKSIEKLNQFRHEHSNKFEVFQGAEEAGLNLGILCALLQAGALEGVKQSRTRVVLEAQIWSKLTDREKKAAFELGPKMDFDLTEILKSLKTTLNDKGKPIIKESRYETIKRHCENYVKIYNQNKKDAKFANWFYERYLLGYSYNTTLKEVFSDQFPHIVSIRDVVEAPENKRVCFAGVVEETVNSVSKNEKKTKYFRLKVVDETESINTLIFNDKIEDCKLLNKELPSEDNIVLITGTRKNDAVFADKIVVQDYRIFMKLNQLKSQETIDKKVNNDDNKV